jgi:hypothetical protein
MKKIFFLGYLFMGLVGCSSAPTSMYYWGNYPNDSYLMYAAPDQAEPSKQIEHLEQDIAKARAKGLLVPPGLYAHLALMYLELNHSAQAEQYFLLEKQHFPESATLINYLLADKTQSQPVGNHP